MTMRVSREEFLGIQDDEDRFCPFNGEQNPCDKCMIHVDVVDKNHNKAIVCSLSWIALSTSFGVYNNVSVPTIPVNTEDEE